MISLLASMEVKSQIPDWVWARNSIQTGSSFSGGEGFSVASDANGNAFTANNINYALPTVRISTNSAEIK